MATLRNAEPKTPKIRKDLSVYGVGMRGFVEVRVGKALPKAHTTSTEKLIIQTVEDRTQDTFFDYNRGRFVYPTKQVEKKIRLTNVTWEGGRVIGTMRTKRFQNYAGVRTPVGVAVCVPPSRVATLLQELQHVA